MVPAPTRVTSWFLPFKPFQTLLWCGILACLLIETIGLLMTYHFGNSVENTKKSWTKSFHFGLVTTLKLFVSQSSGKTLSATSVRVILFSCYVIDIIITSIYGGGLASILTLPTLGEAADSVKRLYEHGLVWSGTSDDWTFPLRTVTDPISQGLLHKYKSYSFEEMKIKAKTENMGFILERLEFGHFANGYYITKEALDRLKIMHDDIYYEYTTFIVRRLWPFLSKFNNLISTWRSAGFAKFWEWKASATYLNENEQEQIQSSKNPTLKLGPTKLDMANFAGILLIWIVGISISIVVFVIEYFYAKVYYI
ncbi:uncharacterized protein LOC119686054 [Teleopsis dalmanni]|uniref:uncharacterized protein LOC119686054 n=1 Tax=Teleopsis dalmanni TaxID=139649 RepID=UPI0018CCEF1C|nr:uncharacterized protein LOC119686054 [Teleopsis dalmanni]